MLEKIRAALRIHGVLMPRAVKEIIEEMGAELDRLRAELDQVKSTTNHQEN